MRDYHRHVDMMVTAMMMSKVMQSIEVITKNYQSVICYRRYKLMKKSVVFLQKSCRGFITRNKIIISNIIDVVRNRIEESDDDNIDRNLGSIFHSSTLIISKVIMIQCHCRKWNNQKNILIMMTAAQIIQQKWKMTYKHTLQERHKYSETHTERCTH